MGERRILKSMHWTSLINANLSQFTQSPGPGGATKLLSLTVKGWPRNRGIPQGRCRSSEPHCMLNLEFRTITFSSNRGLRRKAVSFPAFRLMQNLHKKTQMLRCTINRKRSTSRNYTMDIPTSEDTILLIQKPLLISKACEPGEQESFCQTDSLF